MSEIEIICYRLKEYENSDEPSLYEDYSHKIYQSMDKSEKDDRIAIAKALRDYWIKVDKWKGNLSKKQQVKVKKIKEVLKK